MQLSRNNKKNIGWETLESINQKNGRKNQIDKSKVQYSDSFAKQNDKVQSTFLREISKIRIQL